MRYLLALAVALMLVAPAQAKYLHMAQARPAAASYVGWAEDGDNPVLGRCWHAGPRIVQCSYTLVGVTVCHQGDDTCDLDIVGTPGASRWVVAIAQRRDGLYAHTLGIDKHSLWVGGHR